MSERRARWPMSTGERVVLWLAIALLAYFGLAMAGLAVFWFVGGDGSASVELEPAIEVAATNACGSELFVSRQNETGYSVSSAYDQALAPGASIRIDEGAAFSVRQRGGPWMSIAVDAGDHARIEGADCPEPGAQASSGLVAARTPKLQFGRILLTTSSDGSTLAGARPNSDVTTVVVRMQPNLAEGWVGVYQMAPATSFPPSLEPVLNEAAPGAKWVTSSEFAAAVADETLGSVAFLDPSTGIVVARVWDKSGAS